MNYSELLKHSNWQRKRLEFFNFYDWQCQLCFKRDKQLQLHHKYYKDGLKPWDYPDNAYFVFCERCHTRFHRSENLPLLNLISEFLNISKTESFILLVKMKVMQDKTNSLFKIQDSFLNSLIIDEKTI